jgi:hypothetical protein
MKSDINGGFLCAARTRTTHARVSLPGYLKLHRRTGGTPHVDGYQESTAARDSGGYRGDL